jgi:hypothetical protein
MPQCTDLKSRYHTFALKHDRDYLKPINNLVVNEKFRYLNELTLADPITFLDR